MTRPPEDDRAPDTSPRHRSGAGSDEPPRPRRRRWLGRAVRIVVGLVALVAVAAVGSVVALRSASVRAAVLARVAAAVESGLGIEASARDFSLDLSARRLELLDVTLARPGASAPFLRVPRATARFAWREVLAAPRVIATLTLDDAVWDMDAPIGDDADDSDVRDAEAAEPADDDAPPPLIVRSILVRGGTVVSARPPPGLERWVAAWRWHDFDAAGAFEDGFRLRFGAGPLALEAAAGGSADPAAGGADDGLVEPIPPFALAGGFDLPPDGQLRLEGVALESAGVLSLRADGAGRFGVGARFDLAFEVDARPGALLAGVPAASRLAARGEVELNERVGTVRVEAREVPAEVVRPWLADLGDALALDGTTLEADADLVLGGRDPAATHGHARLVWRRAMTEVLRLDGVVAEPPAPRTEVRVELEARLLPGDPAETTARGALVVPSLDALDRLRFDGVALRVDAADVASLAGRLRRHAPGLVDRLPAAFRTGALALTGRLDGPPRTPRVGVDADWRPAPGERIALRGTFDLAAELARARGRLDLEVSGLDAHRLLAEPPFSTVDHGRLTLAATGGAVAFETFELRAGERRLDLAGTLGFDLARGLAGARLARADLRVTTAGLGLPVAAAAGSLRLADGRLRVTVEEAQTAAGVLGAEASMPVASAMAWPAVAERLAGRVVAGAGGPIEVAATLPAFASAPLLEALGIEIAAELSGDLALDLAVDPLALPAGRASLVLENAALERGEQRVRTRSPLRLTLADGVVRLEPVALELEGLALEAQATAPVAPGWRPGDPWRQAIGPAALAARSLDAGDGGQGPGRLRWSELAALIGRDPGVLEASAEVAFAAQLDPARPERARGHLAVSSLTASVHGEPVAVDDLRLVLEEGAIRLAPTRVRAAGQLVEVAARTTVPRAAPGAASRAWLGPVALTLRAGPEVLGDGAPAFDPGPIAALLIGSTPSTSAADDASPAEGTLPTGVLSSSVDARVDLDLADPAASGAEVILAGFQVLAPARRLSAAEPLRLTLADRLLTLDPAAFESAEDRVPFRLAGSARLAAGWTPDRPAAELVERLRATADGTFDAALANPFLSAYLAGAAARGIVAVEASVDGPLDALRGHFRLRAPDAEMFLARPYFTRIEDFDLDLAFGGGAVRVERGVARLNEGSARLSGGRDRDGGVELGIAFDDVRYRLDYGLTVIADGALRFVRPTAGRPQLSGEVTVAQGAIRRYLDADRQLVQRLFAGTPPGASEASVLDDMELDVTVRTTRGVRVKNNLADLRASWTALSVRGTLGAPRVAGRIDTDPGGFVYAYGQTLRVDRGSIVWSGDPNAEPELDFVFTSEAQDPSVAREGASRFPAALRPEDDGTDRPADDPLTAGVAAYYLDRLAGQGVGALGSLDLTVGRELLIFGEADPITRLTVGQAISPHVTLAASFALQDEGDTTYVLDLHDFGVVERLVAQVFTTDEEDQGATVQQVVELGGRTAERGWPRLRSLRIETPEHVAGRALKRSIGFGKGDRVPPGAAFDIELDVAEHLRRRGHPGAEVQVAMTDPDAGKIAIEVAVNPGPKVDFVFLGDRPPALARRAIRTIYRPDLYEPATLDEIEKEAVRALEAEGYLRPEVEVAVERSADGPLADRTVVVRATGGARAKLEAPRFEGVAPAAAESLAARFGDSRSRVELARDDPAVRERVLEALADLAYPDAGVAAVAVKDGRPTVTVVPGRRRTFADVRIEGIDAARVRELVPALGVAAGDPARRSALSTAAARLENALHDAGSMAARVESALVATETGDPVAVLRVADPRPYVLDEIRFDRAGRTQRRWAERASQLEKGATLRQQDVDRARRELYEIGAFSTVVPRTELRDDGTAAVIFDLEEGPRYRFAFGGRWASSEGLSTVVDLLDRNALGRGIRLGVRGRWAEDDQSGRLFGSLPNVFGTQASLDLFLAGRDRDEDGILTTSRDATLQVSVPHGRRTTTRYYLQYGDQRTTAVIDDPFVGPIEIVDRTSLPLVGFQWLRDVRDDRIEPRHGSLVSIDVSATGSALSSDFSFLRLLAQASAFRTVGRFRSRRVVWAQSARLGLADTFDDQPLLRSERFFAGGEFSVRGYREDSLGPTESLGDDRSRPLGGEALLVLNQELRLPLSDTVIGVLFADAGNVYSSVDELGDELLTAVGMGVRVRTPIGLLRGDAAFPLDRREGDDELELYLGFGYSF